MSNVRDKDRFLQRVKLSIMIPEADTIADEEIKLHIASCEKYLISLGVPSCEAISDNPLVEGLIIVYVKTFFGFKADGTVKELPSSFHLLARQLCLTTEDNNVS